MQPSLYKKAYITVVSESFKTLRFHGFNHFYARFTLPNPRIPPSVLPLCLARWRGLGLGIR